MYSRTRFSAAIEKGWAEPPPSPAAHRHQADPLDHRSVREARRRRACGEACFVGQVVESATSRVEYSRPAGVSERPCPDPSERGGSPGDVERGEVHAEDRSRASSTRCGTHGTVARPLLCTIDGWIRSCSSPNDCKTTAGFREQERRRSRPRRFPERCRGLRWSGRQDLNLRPLGPEPAEGSVPPLAGFGTSSQSLDTTGVVELDSAEDLPRDAPNGAGGEPFQGPVAADLRRTKFEFLRPEDLLPVTAAAQLLGVCVATVHNAINAGKLRCHLFGTARRVRPEDLDAYAQARAAERPPSSEDWRTVRDLMRAAEVSCSEAYRLIDRGVVPVRIFGGVRYIRGDDLAAFARGRTKGI